MSERATALHNTSWTGVFYVTGGGSPFLADVLSTPGASATVLEARVPYAEAALAELLMRAPEQATSEDTARQLAMAAYQRARDLGSGDLFGLGCTASLATNRVKKGIHRAHWAIQTATTTLGGSATYEGDRAGEEQALANHLWQTIGVWLGWKVTVDAAVQLRRADPDPALQALFSGQTTKFASTPHDGGLLLPGSFNPVHEGHRGMLAAGETITGRAGAYELSVRNADKPGLDYLSIEERAAALKDRPVWLTQAPTFAEKAKLFPGATFLLGVDTLERIGQRRFYGDSDEQMNAALQTFTRTGIEFLVFGRSDGTRFRALKDLTLPEALSALCKAVPESRFRNDISSTALRAAR